MPDSEWNEILETNLTGTLHACQVFGRRMIERQSGRIIIIGSLSSFLGVQNFPLIPQQVRCPDRILAEDIGL